MPVPLPPAARRRSAESDLDSLELVIPPTDAEHSMPRRARYRQTGIT